MHLQLLLELRAPQGCLAVGRGLLLQLLLQEDAAPLQLRSEKHKRQQQPPARCSPAAFTPELEPAGGAQTRRRGGPADLLLGVRGSSHSVQQLCVEVLVVGGPLGHGALQRGDLLLGSAQALLEPLDQDVLLRTVSLHKLQDLQQLMVAFTCRHQNQNRCDPGAPSRGTFPSAVPQTFTALLRTYCLLLEPPR